MQEPTRAGMLVLVMAVAAFWASWMERIMAMASCFSCDTWVSHT